MHILPLTALLILVLALAPAVPAGAAPAPPSPPVRPAPSPTPPPGPPQRLPVGPTIVEGAEIAYDGATRIVTARGNVRITHPRFRLFAETVRLDLDTEIITAEGGVRLVDSQGREVRGARLTYAIPREAAVLSGAETIVDQTYIRGREVEARPNLITVSDATVTTCDPARPLYRITARRVEIVPGKELVARDASLWLGGLRVLTLPVYRISLEPGRGESGPTLPRLGYNSTDGLWVDYRYQYGLAGLSGELYLKYGQRRSVFALNTLTYDRPAWSVALVAGRTQIPDPDAVQRTVTLAEGVFAFKAAPVLGSPLGPLFASATLRYGWLDERDSAITATRLDGTAALSTGTFRFGDRLTAAAGVSYRLSRYGTGDRRQIAGGHLTFTYQVDAATTATLGYGLAAIQGRSPFFFDRVDPASTIALGVSRILPDYRLSAAVSHNFVVPESKFSAGAGMRISPSFFVAVAAIYNTRLRGLEDIDYTVEYRCDCLTASLIYRQVRREIWLEFNLRGVSDRLTFQLPSR